MIPHLRHYYDRLSHHRYGVTLGAYVASSFVTGIACVAFMRAFAFVDERRLSYDSVGWWCLLAAPLLFTAAVWLVSRFGPYAAGSGIPQAIYVVRYGANPNASEMVREMSSPRTLAVKAASILLGVWAGASVGREGPTVQIAMCMMFLCMHLLSKILPLHPDPRSLALAGGSAGLAAAFNTPLAGVTFALEELSGGYFENIKDYVLMGIIVAAISAKVLTGEYVYFGKLPDPPGIELSALVIISMLAGLAGHLFARGILYGASVAARFGRAGWALPASCALALLALAWAGGSYILGPGNGAAQHYLVGKAEGLPLLFPAAKLLATVITYWSGVAGGIFAPSLSIGAGVGAEIARLLHYPISSCALVGMSAFLCGAIMAPMTSFVIIFELTGHHSMLLPVMLSALIAYIMLRSLGARSLYPALADRYPLPEKAAQPQ